MKRIYSIIVMAVACSAMILTGCKKDNDTVSSGGGNGGGSSSEVVSTISVSGITGNSASVTGRIDENFSPDEVGACVSTQPSPTYNSCLFSQTAEDIEEGIFTVMFGNLQPGTKYYVRAFVKKGTLYYYGNEKSFTTDSSSSIPEGALSGVFSVSSTEQVYFSKGNLKYEMDGSGSGEWSFMENQYDVEEANGDVGGENYGYPSSTKTVSLFGWGTSGYDNKHPYTTSMDHNDYGPSVSYVLTGDYYSYDWGSKPISNGGNEANMWRTLSSAEWIYLLNERTVNGGTGDGYTYRRVTCGTRYGMLIFHDDYTGSVPASGGTITTASLSSEYAGCVFLPAAGCRYSIDVSGVGDYGIYWSSSANGASRAYLVLFSSGDVLPDYDGYRFDGLSVRLVRAVSE